MPIIKLTVNNMKILAFLFLLIPSLLFATEFKTVNQGTFEWEHDPGKIPPSTISFRVYIVNALTDPGKTNPVMIGTTPSKQYTITLGVEGSYFLGVSPYRQIGFNQAGEPVVQEGEITWSDEYGWGIQYWESLKKITGLRLK